jgi:nitroreductase
MRHSVVGLIDMRYSCRSFRAQPLDVPALRELLGFAESPPAAPFGSSLRLALAAASPGDADALKGLGTYGFIKGAQGFLVGAVGKGPRDLEDFGYVAEQAVLLATDLGLGTCWLGGTFARSNFAKRLGGLGPKETMPAVICLGYPAGDGAKRIQARREGGARLPASSLFFEAQPQGPLELPPESPFAQVVESTRMAPSASNKQPVRVIRSGDDWRFYLQRTKGYGKGTALFAVLRLADLQRVDMGIAMSHFGLVAAELGLEGEWVVQQPVPEVATSGLEYVATWKARDSGGDVETHARRKREGR